MNISNVFNYFCDELKNRTGIMTEDNIRYYWFASMLKEDYVLDRYTLEQPYKENPININGLSNEELDLLYNENNDIFCFEMKFHRNATQLSSSAKTSATGDIFNDLLRLQQISHARRFFLYVTDNVMYNYLTTQNNKNPDYFNILRSFWGANTTPITLNFNTVQTPSTFNKQANKSFNNGTPIVIQNLRLLHQRDFGINSKSFSGNMCHVRLYEIIN